MIPKARLRGMLMTGLYGALVGGFIGLALWVGMNVLGFVPLRNGGSVPRYQVSSASYGGDDEFHGTQPSTESMVALQIEAGDLEGAASTLRSISDEKRKWTVLFGVLDELEEGSDQDYSRSGKEVPL